MDREALESLSTLELPIVASGFTWACVLAHVQEAVETRRGLPSQPATHEALSFLIQLKRALGVDIVETTADILDLEWEDVTPKLWEEKK